MKNLELRKAVLGDEETLAVIQVQSWRSAFRDILSPEDLTRYTDLEKVQEMYNYVLSQTPTHIWIVSIDGQPHAMAAWGDNRDGFALRHGGTHLYPQPTQQLAQRIRLLFDAAGSHRYPTGRI